MQTLLVITSRKIFLKSYGEYECFCKKRSNKVRMFMLFPHVMHAQRFSVLRTSKGGVDT